jgi:hypothetical protein
MYLFVGYGDDEELKIFFPKALLSRAGLFDFRSFGAGQIKFGLKLAIFGIQDLYRFLAIYCLIHPLIPSESH